MIATTRDARTGALALAGLSGAFVAAILLAAWTFPPDALSTDPSARLLAPAPAHPFGTDALGRDMFLRTIEGLALSLAVGFLAASLSAIIALVLATAAAMSRSLDALVGGLVDLALGLPHLVLLILVAYALGGGTEAVVVAVALTHWPRLARVLRAEILQVRGALYVQTSRRLGRSRAWIARHHFAPHLVPQLLVGFVLLFPHAIMHEAALTFLGFGLEPHLPAIGVMLADSMRYLTGGYWWLAVLPGLMLVALTLAFDRLGDGLRRLVSPWEAER
jgi:peptide/nickel transport system permease protein